MTRLIMVNDPVCGMEIEVASAAAQEAYQGTTWYFCSASCVSTGRTLETMRSLAW